MPAWVKDEKTWDKAKAAFKKDKKKDPKTSSDWAVVAHIYKKMGGKIGEAAFEMVEKLFGGKKMNYEERLNNLKEISRDAKKQMDGLVSQKDYKSFIQSAKNIIKDKELVDFGFEDDEIKEWLQSLIRDIR